MSNSHLAWGIMRPLRGVLSGIAGLVFISLPFACYFRGMGGNLFHAFVGAPLVFIALISNCYRLFTSEPALIFSEECLINPDKSLGFHNVPWKDIKAIEEGGRYFKGIMIKLTSEGLKNLKEQNLPKHYLSFLLPKTYHIFISRLDVGDMLTDQKLKLLLTEHWDKVQLQNNSN